MLCLFVLLCSTFKKHPPVTSLHSPDRQKEKGREMDGRREGEVVRPPLSHLHASSVPAPSQLSKWTLVKSATPKRWHTEFNEYQRNEGILWAAFTVNLPSRNRTVAEKQAQILSFLWLHWTEQPLTESSRQGGYPPAEVGKSTDKMLVGRTQYFLRQ